MSAHVRCSRCSTVLLAAETWGEPQSVACPQCRAVATVEVFPASVRVLPLGRAGVAGGADDAACFFHADKRAETACDGCGRFICPLCEFRVGERVMCTACFENGRRQRTLPQTERYRMLPVQLAAWIAVMSLPLFVGLIGGPLAIGLAVWGLRKPRSVTGRRGVGTAVFAILLGGAQLIAWVAFLLVVFAEVWD